MKFVTFLTANFKGFISKTLKEAMKINTEEFAGCRCTKSTKSTKSIKSLQTRLLIEEYLQRNLMLIEKVIVLKHSLTKKKEGPFSWLFGPVFIPF